MQGRADLLEAVRDYASPLVGEALADRAADDLARAPVVLTANHHGVDFFAQSLQSSLAFSLRGIGTSTRPATVPVFACGAIPLNNLTYPRGMLVYRGGEDAGSPWPVKLPVFPDRRKHDVVSNASAFDEEMLRRVASRAETLIGEGRIAHELRSPLREVLESDYADPVVLAGRGYSDQAVMLNQRIWRRLFKSPESAPELIYLELEKIAARLLCGDLENTSSLAWRVLCQRDIRDEVLSALDGQRACWDLSVARGPGAGQGPVSIGRGTVFFWGIDRNGSRFPLGLCPGNPEVLTGVGDDGERSEFPLDPATLFAALKEQRLLPSLFTSYLCIALARGVTCVGGYYQAEYLPLMQRAVADALSKCGCRTSLAELASLVPTTAYLSGMQAVMSVAAGSALRPAGVFEIIGGGRLSEDELGRMAELSLRDAHLASLAETMTDVKADIAAPNDWQERLGADLMRALGSRVVIK